LIDTGVNTETGGRLKRISEYVKGETFCFTYGDGVSDIDITKLINFHHKQGKSATLTAVRPSGRFGRLDIVDNQIITFKEKPIDGEGWVNGGFFILESKVLDLIIDDQTIWENKPMEELSKKGQITAYKHYGFWEAMDTIRDKEHLQYLWEQGDAKWIK
jgi:glucose-1-phosphate cytidylyltransferase